MYVMNVPYKGMDVIIDICLSEISKNPIEIIRKIWNSHSVICMDQSHVMVGSVTRCI